VDGLFKVAGQPPGTDIVNGPEPPMLTPQALEGSNMNPVAAMTRLIDHARSFEAQIRVVKEMKDIDVSGASMMKPV
jgi:flagellar basal-body rod protein FlgF